jgi:hypothetical protein
MTKKRNTLAQELEVVSQWHKKKDDLVTIKLKIVWSYVVENEKVLKNYLYLSHSLIVPPLSNANNLANRKN